MKRAVRILMMSVCAGAATVLQAQNKIDEQRMQRDIEVAENVLSTLIRQQLNRRNFFPFEVEGNYSPGYGVTFRLPMDFGGPMMFSLDNSPNIAWTPGPEGSWTISGDGEEPHKEDCVDCEKVKAKNKVKALSIRKTSNDSLNKAANQKIIEASR